MSDSAIYENWYDAIERQIVDVGKHPMMAFQKEKNPRFAASEELRDEESMARMTELEIEIVLAYLPLALRVRTAPSIKANDRIIKVIEETTARAARYLLTTN